MKTIKKIGHVFAESEDDLYDVAGLSIDKDTISGTLYCAGGNRPVMTWDLKGNPINHEYVLNMNNLVIENN